MIALITPLLIGLVLALGLAIVGGIWACLLPVRKMEREGFGRPLSVPPHAARRAANEELPQATLNVFLAENVEQAAGRYVLVVDVYLAFASWCNRRHQRGHVYSIYSPGRLRLAMREHGLEVVRFAGRSGLFYRDVKPVSGSLLDAVAASGVSNGGAALPRSVTVHTAPLAGGASEV